MKKNYLAFLMLSICVCFVQAQTTHFIDWELSVGSDATITIDVGDTIEWTNVDIGMPHDVSSTDPNAPAGFGSAPLGDLDTYSFTFNSPVVFDYGCGFHPGSMDGTITVINPGGGGYCIPSYNDGCGGGDEIDSFEIPLAGFSHLATGCSPTSYEDYTADTSLEITLEVDQDYNFEITHGYGTQRVRMWIDFNQDEVFDHPGEMVAEESSIGSGIGATSTVGTIDIPMTATLGTTRMRVITRYNTQPEPCDDITDSSWGEIHDYTVHIVNPPPSCSIPMNLILDNVTETTAEFSWDASPDESDGYHWVLMNMGDNPETDTPVDQGTVGTGILSAETTGLNPNNMYQAYVKTLCGEGIESDFSTALHITTEEELDCPEISDLTITNVTDTMVSFTWTEPENTENIEEGYGVIILLEGNIPFEDDHIVEGILDVGFSSAFADELQPDTTFDLYMASVCTLDPLVQSEFVMTTFTTQESMHVEDQEAIAFSCYPNPTSDVLYLQAINTIQVVSVYNLRGQEVMTQQFNNEQQIQLDVTGLSKGVYMLTAVFDTGSSKTLKIIKQ